MRSVRILAVALATVFIGGCKMTVETPVNLSDLLSGPTKTLPSALYVEVAACADYQDSRKPSSSLVDIQKEIPGIFQDAEFVECFRKEMNSFASFSVPVYLDKDKDGKPASTNHINLGSNDTVLLAVVVPEAIQKKMEAAKKKMMGTSLDMRVDIKIKNDTGKDFKFDATSAFVDESPIIYSGMTAPKDAEFVVRLSDVSVQAAIRGTGAMVLYHAPAGS